MKLARLRHPRYADVVATLALIFATSGTAYAVATVHTSDIANGAVTAPKLHDGAVIRAKLALHAVSHAKLGADSVSGSNVAANSLTLADIAGTNLLGRISFSLGANSCGQLNMSAPGMTVGQAAVLSWTDALPTNIVFGPLRVVDATHLATYACNVSGSGFSGSNIGVRIVTFG